MSDYHDHLAGQLPAIRGIVRRLAGTYGLADDMTQECCVRILEKEKLWRGAEAEGWMGVITRRLTLRLRERAARWRSKQKPLPEESPAPEVESGCSEDHIRWVLSQFASLPERQREVLKMRYFEDLSTTAIAERMGVSEPTVCVHHGRAVETLKARARGAGLMGALLGWVAASKWNTAIAGGIVAALGGSAAYFFTTDPDTHLIARGENLKRTVVTPHMDCAMPEGKNVLYCASFQLAWDELKGLARGDLKLAQPRPIADHMNAGGPGKADMPEGSYVARAGKIGDGIVDRINDDLKRTFGQGEDPVLADVHGPPDALLAYAFLARDLAFANPFDVFPEPMPFGTAGERVKSFGVDRFECKEGHTDELALQIHTYGTQAYGPNTADFVVSLQPDQAGEEVLLARLAPRRTLLETVQAAIEIRETSAPGAIGHGAVVQIPLLDFDIQETFTELESVQVTNPAIGQPIQQALQTIRFKLDEKGAILRSRAEIKTLGEGAEPIIFDRAFLILLRRKDSRQPYFALWVDNAEVLVGTAPKDGK